MGEQKCPGHRIYDAPDICYVGLAGFEPTAFRPPDGRATKLRHSPLPLQELRLQLCNRIKGGAEN